MSTATSPEPRVLLCDHCHEEVNRFPDKVIFVVATSSQDPSAPFTCSIQRADFIVSDDEMAFCSITCIKKWLLKWVNTAVALSVKAGCA